MSKLTSRFGLSHTAERAAIKAGVCPNQTEAEAYMKAQGKAEYTKWQRTSNRVSRVAAKFENLSDICPN